MFNLTRSLEKTVKSNHMHRDMENPRLHKSADMMIWMSETSTPRTSDPCSAWCTQACTAYVYSSSLAILIAILCAMEGCRMWCICSCLNWKKHEPIIINHYFCEVHCKYKLYLFILKSGVYACPLGLKDPCYTHFKVLLLLFFYLRFLWPASHKSKKNSIVFHSKSV